MISRSRLSPSALRPRVAQTRRLLEERRHESRVLETLLGSAELERAAGGGLLAGAIAFRFFLFIVPYVFVVVFGLGIGADVADADVQDVARSSGISGLAATAIQSGADASTLTRSVTVAVALVAFLVGARNLVATLWVAHALLWRIPLQKPRHPARSALALIAGFTLLTVLLPVAHALREVSVPAWMIGLALYTAAPVGLWLLTSLRLFAKPPGVTWRHLWPGAVMFGAGVQALHLVTVFWVARSIESKSETYGAIGAALTILLWAYLLGRLVTSCAALNATLWRRSVSTPGA